MNAPSQQQVPHLVRAVLRCLPVDGGPVSRGELRARLLDDPWVTRGNEHRLARLDSTLAGMSRDGLVVLDGESVGATAHGAH